MGCSFPPYLVCSSSVSQNAEGEDGRDERGDQGHGGGGGSGGVVAAVVAPVVAAVASLAVAGVLVTVRCPVAGVIQVVVRVLNLSWNRARGER